MKKRDVIFAVLGIIAIAVAFYPLATVRMKRWTDSVSCGNFMSAIAFGSRAWAEDNNHRMADSFLSISDELATANILICPADNVRKPAESWAIFTTNNSSYEMLRPGMPESDTTNAYFRCTIHGHLGFADGSVFHDKQRLNKW